MAACADPLAAVVATLGVSLPDGGQGELPGLLWPELVDWAAPARAAAAPAAYPVVVGVVEVTRAEVNPLYRAWHPLGEYRRPFGEQHFVLVAHGEPVACATSSSVHSKTVAGGLERKQVVELARIARAPAATRTLQAKSIDDEQLRRALRVMLRCWTDYATPLWRERYLDRGWDPTHAISYAMPGKAGHSYRADGWQLHGTTRPWGGSTGWSGPSRVAAYGRTKRVWLYRLAPSPTPDVS